MRKLILWGALFVLLSTFVYAGLDIQEPNFDFGSSSQEKSTASSYVYLTKTVTLRMTRGFLYKNFDIDFSPENNFQRSNVQIVNRSGEINATNLTEDPTRVFTINLTVPRDFDAVNNGLDPTRFSIGRLKMKADRVNETSQVSTPDESSDKGVTLQVENKLEVINVEIERADDSTNEIDDGETVEVEAGERIKLTFDVRNNFENASDTSFNTVTIDVKSSDLNLEESEEINGIGAGATEDAAITTDIDDEETGTFNVDVEFSGEDEFQGLHGDKFDFKFRVVAATVDEEPTPEAEDSDSDGVPDIDDFCPVSTPRCSVDENGCEVDTDKDGTCDTLDTTPQGEQKVTLVNPPQQTATNNNQNATTSESKQESEIISGLSGEAFAPFIIGFILGLILTAGFFIFIRS